jgi:hypothetical protein
VLERGRDVVACSVDVKSRRICLKMEEKAQKIAMKSRKSSAR